ncbi:unnamed protein product, partial [Didymodactylos carnosus]
LLKLNYDDFSPQTQTRITQAMEKLFMDASTLVIQEKQATAATILMDYYNNQKQCLAGYGEDIDFEQIKMAELYLDSLHSQKETVGATNPSKMVLLTPGKIVASSYLTGIKRMKAAVVKDAFDKLQQAGFGVYI